MGAQNFPGLAWAAPVTKACTVGDKYLLLCQCKSLMLRHLYLLCKIYTPEQSGPPENPGEVKQAGPDIGPNPLTPGRAPWYNDSASGPTG